MGCSILICCNRSSSSSSSSSSKIKSIRIVHLNGYIEYLDQPVTVSEITGKSAKNFLFSHAQFLSSCSTPLKLDERLELERVYFMLPYSIFEANASPLDLAPIVRRLASVAKNNKSVTRLREKKSVCMIRTEKDRIMCAMRQKSSWKPVLGSIGEVSFTQRSSSGSDLSR